MGKAKPRHRNNRNRNKSNPTGIPSVKDTELEDSELNSQTNGESTINNIVEEIQSSDVDEKLCGLRSLATVAENPESVDTILKHKVIKIVAPLLIEKNSEVRNLAAGILRNLSAHGSVEVCERLVKDDIMTPLISLLEQYSEWQPVSTGEDTDTLIQLVNILWNLCEVDETALKYFNSANLLSVLLRCLDHKTVGLDLSITVCQCLNSVSENNAAVLSTLHSHESQLLGLLAGPSEDNKQLFLRTLAAGIIVNLNPPSAWLAAVLGVIHEALGRDLRGAVSQLSSALPLDNTTLLPAETQSRVDDAVALTEAQTMALELLANLTASQDDEMDVESEESDTEEEEMVNGCHEAGDLQPLALSTEVHEGLERYQLVSAVLSKLEPFPENVVNIVHSCVGSRVLAKKLVRLQCRGFLCLNNLVSVADIEQLGGPHRLYSLIKQISVQRLGPALQHPSESNTELVEASTAAIRAILLRLASIKFSDLGEISSSDLEVMMKIGQLPEPRVQANVIRIVGTLGVLLAEKDRVLVKMAGHYLLEAVERQQALWLTAEALDSLLDVFAEDCTDQSAAEIHLVSRLQALAPRLKSKMRQERRTLGEHYPVVSTVMTNLTPFIKYKGARVAAHHQ